MLSPLNKKNLHSVVEALLRAGGERIAIEQGERRLDYAQLDRQANRLGRLLRDQGVAPGRIVALPMPASIEYVVGMLATIKAGGIFQPLDPTYPAERLRQIFTRAAPQVVVGRPADREQSEAVAAGVADVTRKFPPLIDLDLDGEPPHPAAELALPVVAGDDDTGYLIHTSGSTGVPKLIAGRNKGISHFIHWEVGELGLDPTVRASFLAPPTFDVSLREMLVPLLVGGALVIPEAEERADADRLTTWLRQHRITLLHIVPSLFRLLTRALREQGGELPDLQVVALAGEPLYGADVAAWRAVAGSGASLINLYGPSETTLAKAFHRIDQETYAPGAIVPIGQPIANTALLILKEGRLADIGEIGEIHIHTPFASNGYFADPVRTAEAFVPNPLSDDPAQRIYRTGDLGRYRADRSVDFVGRMDRQVKVDGVRIELPEIEGAMRSQSAVTEAAVQAFRLTDGGNRLVGYYTGNLAPEALRAFLETRLPSSMIPGYLVPLADFPRNLNGKIDRKALPRPEALIESDHGYVAPAGALEPALARLWAEALGVSRVSVASPWLQLGGSSLRAIGLIGRINRQFAVHLTLRDFFEEGTIRALARRIAQAQTAAPAPIPPAPDRDDYPLTDGQRRLWILSRIEEGQTLYNNVEWLEFAGALDVPALEQAFQNLVDRHEALRTAIRVNAEGEPRQRILPPWRIELPVLTLPGEETLPALLAKEQTTPFALEAGRPLRMQLFRLAPERWHLLFNMHHIACDGWSMGLLVRELAEGYRAAQAGQPLHLPLPERQIRDIAVWQASAERQQMQHEQAAFWRSRLADAEHRALLPGSVSSDPADAWIADRLPVVLNRQAELRRLLAEHQATPFMAAAAALAILLYRYGGKELVVLGMPVSGRGRAELAGTVGFLINTLPLVLRLAPVMTLLELLERVRRAVAEVYERQDFPFDRLLADYGDAGTPLRHPLFEVFLAMEPAPVDLRLPNVQLLEHEIPQPAARYDLTLRMADDGNTLRLIFEYRRSRFTADFMAGLGRNFARLLEGFTALADQLVSRLPMLDEAELATLAAFARGPVRPLPEQTLHELFTIAAHCWPGEPALITRHGEMSYQALADRTHVLAAALTERIAPGEVVAVLLPPTTDWLATLLAILMAGGVYLPLDSRHPPARLRELLMDSSARLLVAAPDLSAALEEATVEILDPATITAAPAVSLPVISPEAPAYLIYTSGSTGVPKGVLIPHRAFANMILDLIPALDVGPGDRILQFVSPAFDVSLFEIFLALHSGAALALAPRADSAAAEVFAQTVQDLGVTIAMLTPGFLHALGDLPLPSLRLLVTGGEPPNPEDARRCLAAGIRYVNAYGPTETAVNAAFQELTAAEPLTAPIPLGRPVANATLEVLAPDLTPVPLDVSGELVIGGAGLALGYLNRPTVTDRVFVTDHRGQRLYRTGDRVKRRRDGSLVFLGRLDEQVKIRGHRVEIGEIEAALRQIPGIAEARVIVRPLGDELELAAYWTGAPLEPAAVLAALGRRLPDYELPRFCLHLDAFPLTVNGKLDVKRLPTPALAADEPPRPGAEACLAALWGEVLKIPIPGRHADFFALGGRSLAANRLALKASSALGQPVSLRDIYAAPTPAALAARLAQAALPTPEPIPTLAPDAPAPLSPMQRRLWVINQIGEGGEAYHIVGLTRLAGRLDLAALQQAFADLAMRHDALRSRIVMVGGEPRQIADAAGPSPLRYQDTRDWSVVQHTAAIAAETHRPFDLAAEWPLRAIVYAMGDAEWQLLLVLHHIAADGWSMPILERDLALAYRARCAGQAPGWTALPVQYRDVAAWLDQQLANGRFQADADYWRQQLSGPLPVLELPTDFPRPAVRRFQGETRRYPFPDRLPEQLATAAATLAVTPFTLLLATLQILLHRLTRQDNLILGIPVAGRQHPACAELIGFFVNTLPIRDQIDGAESFAVRVARAAARLREALSHQSYPFDRLVSDLPLERDTSHTPLVDVLISLDEPAGAPAVWPEVSIETLPLTRSGSRCDLTWMFDFTGREPALALEYDTDLFSAQRMDDWVARFFLVLEAGLRTPAAAAHELPWLRPTEAHWLLDELNQTAAPYPRQTVIQLFEAQVHRQPEALALVLDDASWSYDRLNRAANRLAYSLQSRLGAPAVGAPITLLAERGAALIVAVLAILKTGAAYLPLEPDAPPARQAALLADSGARLLLRDPSLAVPPLPEGVTVLDLTLPTAGVEDNLPARAQMTDPIYIMYTSGSTGRPKGVVIPQGAVVRLVQGTDYFQPVTGDCLLQLSNYAFDGSTFDLWAALTHGLTLAVPDRETVLDIRRLARFIRRHQVNVTFITTALFNRLADEDPAVLSGFRRLYFGGQEASLPHVQRALAVMADHALNHVYGPTETTTFATWHPVTAADVGPDALRLPIGRSLANTCAYVLDRWLQPTPPGVPGELYIGGGGVALGYLGQPERTAERFLPSPFQADDRLYRTGDRCQRRQDGVIEFLGRLDEQVKIKGYRVELGEIEQRLLSHSAVGKVHVMPRRNAAANLELIAYLTAADEQNPPRRADLHAHLERWLPPYMIPARFVLLPALPLNLNGKVDRNALPPPEEYGLSESATAAAPVSAAERALWQAWREVLGLETFGVQDNYFALGGDSIQAIQIVVKLREAGFALKVTDLLRTPTIAALAAKLAPVAAPVDFGIMAGDTPLTPIQHWFLDQGFAVPAHFNQSLLLHLPGTVDASCIRQALAILQDHHDALRLTFGCGPQGPWQRTLPTQDVSLVIATLESPAALQPHLDRIQQSLEPATGPLLKAALFALPDGPRLFLTVHHWAIDGVSWRILLADLATVLGQAARGEPMALPPRTTPFRVYALGLDAAVHAPRLAEQRDYWREQALAEAGRLPRLGNAGPPAMLEARILVQFTLPPALTEALLGSAHVAYRTAADDLLLAAWLRTLQRFQGHPACRITLEGHGRDTDSADVDLSRTVGWFTALYPLRVVLRRDDWPAVIREVKEARRRVPGGGVGYGLLRYIAKDPELAAATPAEIGFNYLGRFDDPLPIPLAQEGAGHELAPSTRLPHGLDVTAEVKAGALQVRLVGDGERHPASCFLTLAHDFEQALHDIVAHCLDPASGALSPSDVDLAGLDVAGLDALLDAIGHESA